MNTRRDSVKSKAREEKPEQEKDRDKNSEKQLKMDAMVTQINKDSSMSELIASMNMFNSKLNQLASKDYIDKSIKSLVTESFVSSKLETLRQDIANQIKHEIKLEIDRVYERINQVNTKLAEQNSEIENLKSRNSDLLSSLEKSRHEQEVLLGQNKATKEHIKQLENQDQINKDSINDLEQYTRRNSVRIYGMDDKNRTESPQQSAEEVTKLLRNELGMSVEKDQIDIAHRIGLFQPSGNRIMICKFVSRVTKLKVIKERRKLKGKQVVIREDLTFKNAKLLEEVSRDERVKSSWSDEGKVIALLHSGKKMRVKNTMDIARH